MKTFQQFLEEGKKIEKLAKEVQKTVKKDVERQRNQNPEQPVVRDYGVLNSKPGSKERDAEIKAMMDDMKSARKKHWG